MNWKKTAKIDTDFGKEETTNVVWNCFEDLFLLGEKKKRWEIESFAVRADCIFCLWPLSTAGWCDWWWWSALLGTLLSLHELCSFFAFGYKNSPKCSLLQTGRSKPFRFHSDTLRQWWILSWTVSTLFSSPSLIFCTFKFIRVINW